MRKVIEILLGCCFCFVISAQGIKGKVVDEAGSPLEFVNVVLLQLPDSTFIQGTITDENGLFSFPVTGDCLSFSFIGYHPLSIKTSTLGKAIVMTAESKVLNEVVVKGNLPVSKLTADGLKTQIKGSVLSKAGTANDVLRQIPLLKEENGGITVFGKGSPLIYINGRQLRDLTELEQIKSEDIKHIEVITDPGARYNASVGSVIRIRTVRPEGEGFGLSLRSDYFQAEKEDLVEQVNLNYRNKGFDLFGLFQYDRNNYWQKSVLSQSVFVDTLWNQQNTMKVEGLKQNYQAQLGFNYQLNDNHLFGSRYRNLFSPDKKERSQVESLVLADGEYFDRWQNEERKLLVSKPTFDWNLYYTGKIGQLTADFNMDLLWSGQNNFSVVNEESAEQDDRLVESENKVRNRLLASKLILGYPLWGGTLNGGAEYSRIHREDDYINHQQIVPTSYSRLEERSVSSFVEYSRLFKFGLFKAGLRYERVKFDYYENDVYKPGQSKIYNQLFPNLSLGTQIKDLQMRFAFSSKVHRPSFSQLSNNVFYGNRYTLQTGNPYLKPAIDSNLSFQASWKFIQMMIDYKQEKDAIIYSAEQLEDNPAVTKVMFRNFDKLKTLSCYFTAGYTFGIYMPRINVGLRKQWMSIESNKEKVQMNRPLWNLSFNQSVKLPFDILFTLNFSFQTKGDYQNVFLNTTQYIMDASLMKTFLKDHLSFQLKGYDLLNGYRDGNLLYNKQMQIDMLNRNDRRRVGLVVQYKFNMKKNKYKGSGAGNSGKERL